MRTEARSDRVVQDNQTEVAGIDGSRQVDYGDVDAFRNAKFHRVGALQFLRLAETNVFFASLSDPAF